MIDKELIRQAAEDIDIFEDDLTEEFERLCPPQPRQREKKLSAVIIALRSVSTIAAACLIGLFLYQQSPTQTTNEVLHYYTSSHSAGSTLKEVYTRPQQQTGLISYNQLKKMLYEKK